MHTIQLPPIPTQPTIARRDLTTVQNIAALLKRVTIHGGDGLVRQVLADWKQAGWAPRSEVAIINDSGECVFIMEPIE